MTKQENLELIHVVAKKLGVNLKQPGYSVTTSEKVGRAKTDDGSLEVILYPDGEIRIEGKRGMGISIDYIDNVPDNYASKQGALKDAVYRISCYNSKSDIIAVQLRL